MSTPRRAHDRFSVVIIAAAGCALALGCASTRQHRQASTAAGGDADGNGGTTRTAVTIIGGDGSERQTTSESPPRDEVLWGGLDVPVAPPPQPGTPVAKEPPATRSPSIPPPPLVPAGPTDGVMIEGKASRYQLQAALEDNRSAISACAPKGDGRAVNGTVVLSFRIGREGEPKQIEVVRSSFIDTGVGECLKRAIKGITVPEARGGETNVVYPFHFGEAG